MHFNCTPSALEDFPKDLFSKSQLEHGALTIHILATLYLFIAIAIVCDEYFVPVVEEICQIFHIPSDIGGATFMACATSSPELFVNIVGTFVTEGDLGIGTIVGSAVFNILAVPACCGLTLALNRSKLKLEWWPLTRDSLIYGISVCLLIIFLNDEKIEWYEAMTLVLVYVFYIIFLIFDKHIQNFLKDICKNNIAAQNNETPNNVENPNAHTVNIDNKEIDDNNDICLWKWPNKLNKLNQIIWVLNWPINVIFSFTIPKTHKTSNKWIPLIFIMCIIWIGVLSYILSWMLTVVGDIFKIPDSVMGISFLAMGAGVPEAASSIIVVKKGKGAMGISNSLGSNTFDILLCLGVPWLLKSTVISTKNWVNINSSGLQYSTITLLVTLLAFYLALSFNKYKLDKWAGVFTMVIYLLFLVVAILIELNVFFIVNQPICR